jgi:hypothetical protein
LSFRRWLRYDGSWIAEHLRWKLTPGLPIAAVRDVIAAHAGPFIEAYELVLDRIPGRALRLDEGSDSMRFAYFAESGFDEPPILYVDHDDTPVIGVACPGFDVWIAKQVGLLPWDTTAGASEAATISQQLFGAPSGLDMTDLMG